MARWAVIVLVASCGRIGFESRVTDGGDGGDDTSDAAPIGFSHLVAYGDQTCAIYRGLAYCWGENASGQLGIPNTVATSISVPTAVQLPAGRVDDLTEGVNHGCAIVDGTLYCYGASLGGPPTPVALPSTATAVGGGNGFTCVVAGSTVYCWGGSASAGQLAVGDTNPRVAPTQTPLVATTAISIGDDHGCALEAGAAVCWGHNDFGALGFGSMTPQNNPVPVAVLGSPTVLPKIAGWHACDLDTGTVRCWGEGDHGEVGDGLGVSTATPTIVPGAANATAIGVGGGPADLDASCAVIGGDVRCWGNGNFGRLGQGVATNSLVPIAVAGLPGPAIAVALGYAHSCALLADGDLWCWGRGVRGQLGDGLSANSLVPVRVVPPP